MLDPKTLIKHCVNANVCGFCDSQLGPALTFSEDNKDDNVSRAAITTPSRDAAPPPASHSREPRTSPRLGSAGVGASPTRGGLLLSASDTPAGGMLGAGQGSRFAPEESTVLLAARKVHMCMHGRMRGCTLYESLESCVGGVVFRLCVGARGDLSLRFTARCDDNLLPTFFFPHLFAVYRTLRCLPHVAI